jgi:hypothetical protein
MRRICVRLNQKIPSDFALLEGLVCGEVGKPQIPKDPDFIWVVRWRGKVLVDSKIRRIDTLGE